MPVMHLLSRIVGRLSYRVMPDIASALRKRWAILKNPHATIRFGRHTYCGPGFSLWMPHGGTFIAGDACEFRRGFRAEVGEHGRVVIGDHSRFTYDVLIQCSTSMEFGNRVMAGQCTQFADGGHRFRDLDTPMLEQGYDFRPLRIADDVTILSKCTIVNDIGERAVVAANAVVTRPVPPFTVVAGVPAKPIDYFGPAPDESQAARNAAASS